MHAIWGASIKSCHASPRNCDIKLFHFQIYLINRGNLYFTAHRKLHLLCNLHNFQRIQDTLDNYLAECHPGSNAASEQFLRHAALIIQIADNRCKKASIVTSGYKNLRRLMLPC